MKVLITGGNGDIAKAIRDLLIEKGYDVFAPGRDTLDVTNLNSIEDVISNYKPDILINNAGYVVPQSIKNADTSRTIKHIEINLTGTFLCTEIGLKYNKNLKIVNVGSAASIESHSTWSEYCATKAGVAMATKCWAEDGIDVVCISPGRTKTKMRKSLFPDEDQNTLLNTEDFAKVVFKAIENGFEKGSNIIVRKQNVEMLLKGEN